MKGLLDSRGQLVYEYLRFIKTIRPKFFLFENVPGLISKTHFVDFMNLMSEFNKAGYNTQYSLLNAKDFNVAQDRKRVFIFGLRTDIDKIFAFDDIPRQPLITLQDVIGYLKHNATPTLNNKANSNLKIQNHEYYVGGFSSLYMSRNRKKQWGEQSFTIQASGRHAPLHPDSSDMVEVSRDVRVFTNQDILTRRLTVKECALIQSFPNDYVFLYDNIDIGYKMIGNAVPVKLSYAIAKSIHERLFNNEY
jgi:DNA (cytosine-5)-methyltransferase 1